MKLYTLEIILSDRPALVACDGQCHKAWGIIARPKLNLGGGDDDVVWLADGELDDAPAQSRNWEGGFNKPASPEQMNRWCTRQCERSEILQPGQTPALHDFSLRRYNQPWLHLQALQDAGHPQLERGHEIAYSIAKRTEAAQQSAKASA